MPYFLQRAMGASQDITDEFLTSCPTPDFPEAQGKAAGPIEGVEALRQIDAS
jgi:hypothetical protein